MLEGLPQQIHSGALPSASVAAGIVYLELSVVGCLGIKLSDANIVLAPGHPGLQILNLDGNLFLAFGFSLKNAHFSCFSSQR